MATETVSTHVDSEPVPASAAESRRLKPKMKPFKYLFTLAVPLAAVFGALWMLSAKQGQGANLTYDTALVSKGPIRKVVASSGPVRALVTVLVGSQISGQIDKMNVDYNSEVKEGDVLATIDPRTFEARVAQAKADIESAKAALANQEAALNKAMSVQALTEKVLARQQTLQEKGFASTQNLDNAVRDLAVAKADIEVAKAQIESAKANIAQRIASMKQSEIDLERTRIVSPVNGTVISRSVDQGQTVASNFQSPELFKIAQDLRRIRIEAQVNEADIGQVSEGNPVTFSVDAFPDRTFDGQVTQVRLSATELQNIVTYTVIIEAKNEDRKLFPGMTANVQIEVAKNDNVLRVPNDALRFKPRSNDGDGGRGADRVERTVSRVKLDLQLSDEQEAAVKDQLQKLLAQDAAPASGIAPTIVDPAAMRQKVQTTVEQTLAPMLTAEQKPLFDRWKRGHENTKTGNVHVVDASNAIDKRFVRLGLADDRFTEITGGTLAEGERVVLRAREAQK